MNQESQKQLTQSRWIWLTIAGWFIGVALVIGLGILAETILQGKEGLGGQALVGVGMGIGVGLMQWILLRKYLRSALNWLWCSILGFTVAYVASDVVAFFITIDFDPGTILPLATFIGALISGWLQYVFVLKKSVANSQGWIVYNAVAWLLAHLLTMGMFLIKIPKQSGVLGVLIIILAFVFILIGGPLLGFITGRFIVPLINKQHKTNNSTNA